MMLPKIISSARGWSCGFCNLLMRMRVVVVLVRMILMQMIWLQKANAPGERDANEQ